jgi:hypothetical protein
VNIFKIFGTIALDGKDQFNKDIDEATNKGSTLASKLGGGLKTAAKVGGAAIAAAATGVAALTKASAENYAEYEQLVGGVETLFKDSADKVQQYADNAYKTAGMSANEYMSTVTSFSASLLQSLGGDTEAAADKADQAITDMSDNANKMGTSMEMIQNAYQGFAKQNYTMLDNLKLGYGGTKEEMERLLADAEKLSGVKYDISSYADIVDAIHVVQTEMGITGTTAKEASSTIQGSLSSMKSAWQNLIVGIADENADMEGLINNFVDSIVTVGENLIPRIEQIFLGIGTLIEKLAPVIGEALPKLITTVLPSLLNAGMALLMGLIEGIVSNFDALLEAAFSAIDMLLDGIIENLPRIIEMGIEILAKLAVGLIQAIPNLVMKIPEIIAAVVKGFVNSFPKILQVGRDLISSLWDGIKQMWKNVVSWASNAISNLFGGKNKVNVAVDGNVNGSHAGGLNYVPFNGYIAELHKGEMVVPADEARKLRNGTTEEKNIIINLTTTLDGKVIGETSYKYAQNMARAMGV